MDLMQLMGSGWVSKAVSVSATLGIADLLKEESKTLDELSELCHVHADTFRMMMRVLDGVGIFSIASDGLVSNTPTSEQLKSDHPSSMRHYCMLAGDEYDASWARLLDTVKTGKSGFELAYGESIYRYMDKHPERGAVYDFAMEDISRHVGKQLASQFNTLFDNVDRVMDVGGGSGIVLRQILSAYPHISGSVLDRETVCQRAGSGVSTREAFHDRLIYKAGSFFDDIPADADVYILKNVLHNWNTEHCIALLSNMAQTLKKRINDNPSARTPTLLVIEPLIEKDEKSLRLLVNALLQIVICQDGTLFRTNAEMKSMISRCLLEVRSVYKLGDAHSVIEAQLSTI